MQRSDPRTTKKDKEAEKQREKDARRVGETFAFFVDPNNISSVAAAAKKRTIEKLADTQQKEEASGSSPSPDN